MGRQKRFDRPLAFGYRRRSIIPSLLADLQVLVVHSALVNISDEEASKARFVVMNEGDMELQLGEAMYFEEDEDFDPVTVSSVASSTKTCSSRLPRCAVVNFKKNGDQISVEPRAQTDTGAFSMHFPILSSFVVPLYETPSDI